MKLITESDSTNVKSSGIETLCKGPDMACTHIEWIELNNKKNQHHPTPSSPLPVHTKQLPLHLSDEGWQIALPNNATVCIRKEL